MKAHYLIIVIISIFFCGNSINSGRSSAHFQAIIPSDDIVMPNETKSIGILLQFCHPFEGQLLQMERPVQVGVLRKGEKQDLLSTFIEQKSGDFSTWKSTYQIEGPGDHVFYVEPKPYWEPAEETYIIHYAKVIVNGLGLEVGWEAEVGLKLEIIPLTRPYGLWTGNVFQGLVKYKGKPVPHAKVEVEYYNEQAQVKSPADPFITQVIKADENGVFTYAMPRAGWWGFAALMEDDHKIAYEGVEKPVEIGGIIWIKTTDMK